MAGEAPPAARPPVEVSPEQLLFKLAANSQPGCPLAVRNPSDVPVAFKVKTTEPRRYLVRPNQGLVAAESTEAVNVWLVEKECNALLERLPPDGHSGDKFLVQTVAVDSSFFSRVASLNSVQQADELTNVWAKAAKTAVRNKKLPVRFLLPPSVAAAATTPQSAASTPRSPAIRKSIHGASPTSTSYSASPTRRYGGGGSDRGGRGSERHHPSPMDDDSRELVGKYDDLVNYTANLTEERDELNQSLEEAKKALQREMAIRIALESKGQPQRRQGANGSRASGGGRTQVNHHLHQHAGGGFGWFTLSIVAFVFFFLGQWLDFAGTSSSNGGSRNISSSQASVVGLGNDRTAAKVAPVLESSSSTSGDGGGGEF